MKLQDIPVQQFGVRVKSSDGGSLDHLFARFAGPVQVANVAASETDGSFDVALADAWLSVSPTKEADTSRLVRELSIGRAMLAELADLAADGSVELRIAFFVGPVVEMGDHRDRRR